MKSSHIIAIAFAMMLGTVVGIRLSMEGLLFVATFLTSTMLLVPLFMWRSFYASQFSPSIDIKIENPNQDIARIRAFLGKLSE